MTSSQINIQELDKKLIRIQRSTKALMPWASKLHNFLRMHFRWYYRWHINPIARTSHWVFLFFSLVVFSLFTAVLISNPQQHLKAASLTKTWDDTIDLSNFDLSGVDNGTPLTQGFFQLDGGCPTAVGNITEPSLAAADFTADGGSKDITLSCAFIQRMNYAKENEELVIIGFKDSAENADEESWIGTDGARDSSIRIITDNGTITLPSVTSDLFNVYSDGTRGGMTTVGYIGNYGGKGERAFIIIDPSILSGPITSAVLQLAASSISDHTINAAVMQGGMGFYPSDVSGNSALYNDILSGVNTAGTFPAFSSVGTAITTYDSGLSGTYWNYADWTVTVPTNTDFEVRLRAADTEAGLSAAEWSEDANHQASTFVIGINHIVPTGRYAQIKIILITEDTTVTPIFDAMTVHYNTPNVPAITSIDPSNGDVGDIVVITGTDFGLNQGNSTISIGAVAGSPTTWTNTSIILTVPVGAAIGAGSCIITTNGGTTNYPFVVTTAGDYSITASSGANGTISPPGTTSVATNGSQSYTVTSNDGYHISDVRVNGSSVGAVSSYNFTNVTANHTISATFDINTYTITATTGSNGSITSPGATVVNWDSSKTYTFTSENHYHIGEVLVDGVSNSGAIAAGFYTFSDISANHTVSVVYTRDTYAITATAGQNGSILTPGVTMVGYDYSKLYTFTPNNGYLIYQVLVDGVNNPTAVADSSYWFDNVDSNHTIAVTFIIRTYSINAVLGSNGAISSPGITYVSYGQSKTYTFTPAVNYHIETLVVDANPVDLVSSYTFSNISGDHSIYVSFAINTYTISINKAGNGDGTFDKTIPYTVVNMGDILLIKATAAISSVEFNPNTDWSGCDSIESDLCKLDNIISNRTVIATFKLKTFTIKSTAGVNGLITPAGVKTVNYGDSQSYLVTAALGYNIRDVRIDGATNNAAVSSGSYAFTSIIADHTIDAAFATMHTVTGMIDPASNARASINPSNQQIAPGGNVNFMVILIDAGSEIVSWTGCMPTTPTASTCSITNIDANHDVVVKVRKRIFTVIVSSVNDPVSRTDLGSINGVNPLTQVVNYGDSAIISTMPENNSIVVWNGCTDISTDGYQCTVSNVTSDKTVTATFRPKQIRLNVQKDLNSVITDADTASQIEQIKAKTRGGVLGWVDSKINDVKSLWRDQVNLTNAYKLGRQTIEGITELESNATSILTRLGAGLFGNTVPDRPGAMRIIANSDGTTTTVTVLPNGSREVTINDRRGGLVSRQIIGISPCSNTDIINKAVLGDKVGVAQCVNIACQENPRSPQCTVRKVTSITDKLTSLFNFDIIPKFNQTLVSRGLTLSSAQIDTAAAIGSLDNFYNNLMVTFIPDRLETYKNNQLALAKRNPFGTTDPNGVVTLDYGSNKEIVAKASRNFLIQSMAAPDCEAPRYFDDSGRPTTDIKSTKEGKMICRNLTSDKEIKVNFKLIVSFGAFVNAVGDDAMAWVKNQISTINDFWNIMVMGKGDRTQYFLNHILSPILDGVWGFFRDNILTGVVTDYFNTQKGNLRLGTSWSITIFSWSW